MARRGAVAQAIAAGAQPDGLDDLMEIAAAAGPPPVPKNLGNFPDPAERGARQGNRAERRATSARARHAESRVTPIRRAQHMPTFEDEALERQVQAPGEDVGDQGDELEDDAQGLEAGDERELGSEAEYEDESDADLEDLSPALREELQQHRAWRAESEAREQERDERLQQITEQLAGRAVPGARVPGQPDMAALAAVAQNDPRVRELAVAMQPANLFPWAFDDNAQRILGLTPEAAGAWKQTFNAWGNHLLTLGMRAIALENELRGRVTAQQQQDTAQLERAGQAFWTANPDLARYQKQVNRVSAELRARNPSLDAGRWIAQTSIEVRKELRAMGINVPLYPSSAGVRQAGAANRGGMTAPAVRRAPMRPAAVDFGGGRGGGERRARLEPVTQDILDLARF